MAEEHSERAERDALDAVVMLRIREGDDSAVAKLYDRYAPLALGLALKIVREPAEAEDIVHDAFVAVVERADQFHPERGSVVSWLVATVRNLALDRTRRRVRRSQIIDEDLRFEPSEPVLDPEMLSAVAHDRGEVRKALAALSPAQRSTLEVAFFEGLSYPEIAERDGVPLGTVKSRAARALNALRVALDGGARASETVAEDEE